MSVKLVRKVLIMALCLVASNSALAGGYIGLGFGTASWDIKPLLGTYEVDDGTPLRIFGGSRTGQLGWEIDFSMSEHDWYDNFGIIAFSPGGKITHMADNLIFSVIGFLPLSPTFDLYGKLGLNMWSTTVEVEGVELEGDDGIDLAAGAGLNINVAQNFLIRLEAQYLPGIGDGIDEGDITQFTAGGAYSW